MPTIKTDFFKNNDYFFFFETNKFDKDNYRSYYFIDPVKVIRLDHPESTIDFFNELNELKNKYYVAGFFSYELGYILEEAFKMRVQTDFPYAFFCAYENLVIFDHNLGKFVWDNLNLKIRSGDYAISNLELNITEDVYSKNIEIIRDYIRKGDIYQANYTVKYKFDFSGSSFALYNDLKQKQFAAYNVFAGFDGMHILSLSPELFFRKRGGSITVKPMKGTWYRGRTLAEDNENRDFLANDEKNRSENVMIVDLLRNDLGKVSKAGSVNTTKLYEVEKYNTLFQMTSTIKSVPENNLSVYDLIKGIFPSGSITGAPKIRSMQIIKELEKEERKLYTGSIGFFEPSGDAVFNVAIRTLLLKNGRGEMGVGGGIVYDSTPEDEFKECKLKADFLVKKTVPEFSLIETILFDRGYEHLDLHIKRMHASAEYFDYIFDRYDLENKLIALQKGMKGEKYKVRVLLSRFGIFTVTKTKIEENNVQELKITLSETHTESNDNYLFHKTTARDFYESELADARERGFFDVVFMNKHGDITEGAITNIYANIRGALITPPVECGLLNGVIRQTLLANGKAREQKLTLKNLQNAEELYISNSIIGFRKALFA
ncbi:MAG: aminodeoxychorismate synthase component I [Spirochaetes bacterium]|nr:aminodeoxychorismate synthase component I [Spirochaetota bacterium]